MGGSTRLSAADGDLGTGGIEFGTSESGGEVKGDDFVTEHVVAGGEGGGKACLSRGAKV